MTVEIGLMIIIWLLVFIGLLLFSVLKGIGDTLDQRKEIFTKQLEWMNDINSLLFTGNDNKERPLIIGEENPNNEHQKMFEDGIEKINELSKEKSKKQ